MQLKVWRPLFDLEKEMTSLFERLERDFDLKPFEFRPSIDVDRTDEALMVAVELPGIDPDKDVEISIDGDMLVLKGEKTHEREISEKDRVLRERHYGSFERRLPLPDGVDPDKIEATYDKGILTVKVPMPEAADKPSRRIPVAAKS